MPVEVSDKQAAGKLFPMLKVWGDRPGHPAVALNRPVCLVGRRGMHLSLESPTVSRTHALIVNDARHVYIRDLASRNGTTVNGAAVHEAELAEAAVVRIGSYALRCEAGFPKSPEEVPVESPPAVELHVDGHAVPIPLGQKTVLIGQREGCEIQLVDPEASPVHAVVFELQGKRHVRDLNSENGTFVNGQPVRQAELKDGDEIRVGRTKIRHMLARGGVAARPEDADDIEAISSLDEITEAAAEEPETATPPLAQSIEEVLGDATTEPAEAEIGGDEPEAAEADIDVDIDIEPEPTDDENADFGSTALESNLERLAASPARPGAMGDLEEPEVVEPADKEPGEDVEAFIDVEAGAEDEAPNLSLVEPDLAKPPAAEPEEQPLADEPLAASQQLESESPPPAEPIPVLSESGETTDTTVPLTSAAGDAVADAPASVAVEADQLPQAVDASSGPIELTDDDMIEIVEDERPAPAPEPEPSLESELAQEPAAEPSEETHEILEEVGEVVNGKVVSPPPFADAGPLTVSPVAPKPTDTVGAAPPATSTGVFAKADLIEPARPSGLQTGAAALPAPPTGGIEPAPQARLEPMDDVALADVVASHLPAVPAQRKRRPTRVRVRQLSKRVRDLSARVAALEAALIVAKGSISIDKPIRPGSGPEVAPTPPSPPQPGRDR